MKIKKAMILAAGRGTRLRPITHRLPKPLVDIGGISPLIRTLHLFEDKGIEDVVINLHSFADTIRCAVDELALRMRVHYFHEETLLETGGGIKQALPVLGPDAFLVVNGDIVWKEEEYPLLQNLVDEFDEQEMDALLTMVPLARVKNFRKTGGDFSMASTGCLGRPEDEEEARYVYGGIQVMHPRLIAGAKEDRFTLLPHFLDAIEQKRLFGHLYEAPWVDIGTPEGLAVARTMMAGYMKMAG